MAPRAPSIEACGACGDTTPHSAYRPGPAGMLALLVGAGAVWAGLTGAVEISVVVGLLALALAARERRRHGFVRCERCRWKRVRAERQRTCWRPGRATETSFLG